MVHDTVKNGKMTYCSWLFGIKITDGIIRGKCSNLSEKIDCDIRCWFSVLPVLPVSHDVKPFCIGEEQKIEEDVSIS